MKHLLTAAGISLLAWLAIAPFQPAEAQTTPNGSPIESAPNEGYPDNLGDDPGVDSYEVEGTGEADTPLDNQDVNTRDPNNPNLNPSVERPRYNRPVTGQTSPQPSVDYNRPGTGQSPNQDPNFNRPGTSQSPNQDPNQSPNYSSPEPVRGLW